MLVRVAVAFWGEAHEALMRLQGGDDLPEIWWMLRAHKITENTQKSSIIST